MASSFVATDTMLSMTGSHLRSTTPDIYQQRSDREENRSGPADQLARVMSPSPTDHSASSLLQGTTPNDQLAVKSNDDYSGRFDVAQVYCQDCNTLVSCLYVCTGCGIYGHTQCLRLEKFFDYLICPPCLQKAAAEFASFQDAERRVEWRNSLEQQIIGWRSRVTEAIGMSSLVGVAMGGAMVAVAGVAAGLAHGVVRGAALGSNIFQFALPGMNGDQASTAYQSAGDPSARSEAALATRLADSAGSLFE